MGRMKYIIAVAVILILCAVVLFVVHRDDGSRQDAGKEESSSANIEEWLKIRDKGLQEQAPEESKPDMEEAGKKVDTGGSKPEFHPFEPGSIGFEKCWETHLRDRQIVSLWLLDGAIYTETKGHWLYKIDTKAGHVLWVYDVEAGIDSAPFVYKYEDADKSAPDKFNEIYVLAKGTVHCVDEEAGFRNWTHKPSFAPSCPVFASDSCFHYGSADKKLHAIDKEKREYGSMETWK